MRDFRPRFQHVPTIVFDHTPFARGLIYSPHAYSKTMHKASTHKVERSQWPFLVGWQDTELEVPVGAPGSDGGKHSYMSNLRTARDFLTLCQNDSIQVWPTVSQPISNPRKPVGISNWCSVDRSKAENNKIRSSSIVNNIFKTNYSSEAGYLFRNTSMRSLYP